MSSHVEPVDPVYEFDAPQHFEFGALNDSIDHGKKVRHSAWFEKRLDTPAKNKTQKDADEAFEKWEKDNECEASPSELPQPQSTTEHVIEMPVDVVSVPLASKSDQLSALATSTTVDDDSQQIQQPQPPVEKEIQQPQPSAEKENEQPQPQPEQQQQQQQQQQQPEQAEIKEESKSEEIKPNKRRLINLVSSWMDSPSKKRTRQTAASTKQPKSAVPTKTKPPTRNTTAKKPAKQSKKPLIQKKTTSKKYISVSKSSATEVIKAKSEKKNSPIIAKKKKSSVKQMFKPKIKTSGKGAAGKTSSSSSSSKKAVTTSPKTPPSSRAQRTLTKPTTPSVLKRPSSTTKRVLSTEEREMEEFQQKRKEMTRRRKLSSSSFKRLSSSSGFVASKSEKELTVPQSPSFKGANPQPRSNVRGPGVDNTLPSRPNDHGMVLRGRSTKNLNLPKRTVPKPFNLHKKALDPTKEQPKSQPFIAVAQKVQKFFKCTPERFRTLPKGSAGYQKPAIPMVPLERTIPVAPKLITSERAKPSTMLSSEDQLVKDINSRGPFKANPLNGNIMNSVGDLGLPRVVSIENTVPKDVVLSTESRARPVVLPIETPIEPFHAQSVPDFSKVTGVPEKKLLPSTVPNPPSTQLERSVFTKPPSPTIPKFKAQPLPDNSPFKVTLQHKHVVLKPFQGMETHKNPMLTRKRLAEIELQKLEEARKFKANPIPDLDNITQGMPNVHSKEVTVPQPFALRSEQLHQQRQRELKEQEAQLEQEIKEASNFHASKPRDTSKAFVPAKSRQALTTINSFHLTLEQRVGDRKQFDQTVTEHRAEDQLQLEKQTRAQDKLNQMQVNEMRKTLVHKPLSMPTHAQPLVIKHSEKILTEPASPLLGSKRQQQLRA